MAIFKSIKYLALDIGGVVIDVDKTAIHQLISLKHQRAFFDDDFWSLQKGQLSPENFFRKKCSIHNLIIDQLTSSFRNMIRVPEVNVLSTLRYPYFFMSNTNQIHFADFARKLKISDFAQATSILSYQVGCMKPQEQFFRSLSKNIKPETVLYIDDKRQFLNAAKAMGFQTLLCQSSKFLPSLLRRHDLCI